MVNKVVNHSYKGMGAALISTDTVYNGKIMDISQGL